MQLGLDKKRKFQFLQDFLHFFFQFSMENLSCGKRGIQLIWEKFQAWIILSVDNRKHTAFFNRIKQLKTNWESFWTVWNLKNGKEPLTGLGHEPGTSGFNRPGVDFMRLNVTHNHVKTMSESSLWQQLIHRKGRYNALSGFVNSISALLQLQLAFQGVNELCFY